MRGKYLRKKKKTYAIYGMGSTRLAIALANYYASFLKKKVAIAEIGEGNLSDIADDVQNKKSERLTNNKLVGFTRMKVDYYPYLDMDYVTKVSNEAYDVILWDFKEISHDYLNLYRYCDKKFFLSNIAPHNRRLFCNTKNLFENDAVEVEFYCYLLNKQDKKWYDKTVGKVGLFSDIREIPFIKDPNKLTREDITFLEKMAVG